jgi:hypothetical protein
MNLLTPSGHRGTFFCLASKILPILSLAVTRFAVAPVTPWNQVVNAATLEPLRILALTRAGEVSWSNAYPDGICTVETADQPWGPWRPRQNLFTTNTGGATRIDSSASHQFVRLLALDISTNSSQGFSNLVMSYGHLHTIAGNGSGRADVINYWLPGFENGPATNAALSRPHFAMADGEGNIYIADKDSHAVLKVTTNGTIHTVAGTHAAGNGQDKPDYGANVALNSPTGLWVRRDGTVFILDTNNGKVRRLTPAGIVSTLLALGRGLNVNTGRGLWVSDDETLAYLCRFG